MESCSCDIVIVHMISERQKSQLWLFEISGRKGYDSETFSKSFMKSAATEDLDKRFSFMQWCGEAYILSRLQDENADDLRQGEVYDNET